MGKRVCGSARQAASDMGYPAGSNGGQQTDSTSEGTKSLIEITIAAYVYRVKVCIFVSQHLTGWLYAAHISIFLLFSQFFITKSRFQVICQQAIIIIIIVHEL